MQIGLGLGLTGGALPPLYPDATLALDFLAGAYRVGAGRSGSPDFASLSGLTVTRASTKYAQTSAGVLVPFGSGVAAITDQGLLVEEARTNLFLNSFAPATQTITITATSHTITVWGTGSVTVAAGTATISNAGAASAGSPRTIGCTVGGTITVTVTGSPTVVQVEAGAFGTSPISTAGASATRAADVVSIGGLTFPAAMTLLTQFSVPVQTTAADRYAILAGTVGPAMVIKTDNTVSGAIPTVGYAAAVARAGTVTKAAYRFSQGAQMGAVDGTLSAASTMVWTPSGASASLGSQGGTSQLNGYLQKALIYSTALSDAQLQAATT